MSTGTIIVKGVEHPCLIPVHAWTRTRYHFTPRPMRTAPTRWCMVHWTGAENPAEAVFRNMANHRNRKTGAPEPLSVHFVIDQLGDIYQMMDAQARGAHCAAQGANAYAVGIEIVNRGHDFTKPTRGFNRPKRTEIVHGVQITYGDFFYAQQVAAIALTQAICAAYGLPVEVPRGPDGDVLARVLTRDELYAHHGVVGHYHAEAGKPDPAPELLRKIAAAGQRPSRRPPVA